MEAVIASLEPMVPITRGIGLILCTFVTIFAITKMLRGGPFNVAGTVMQFGIGVMLIFPTQILTIPFNLVKWLTGVSGMSPEPEPEQANPPVEVPVTNSAPADLSWIPTLLTVAGIAVAAIATGLGLFHYYRKSIRPSLEKARSQAASVATLVAEARKTLEWVMLDSASYETDLAKQIDYPLMTDVSEPLVGAYIREMRQVQELDRALSAKPLLEDARHFSSMVIGLKVSYEAAVAKAERVRWGNFSASEQKRLKDARIALNVVQDSSTTPEQRNAQYKRIAKLLDGLITLTEPVKLALAEWVPMLAIEGKASGSPVTVDQLVGGKAPVAV